MTTKKTPSSKYKLLVFDWDGTLMDSLGHIIECTNRVAEHFSLKQPTRDEIRDAIGLPTLAYIIRIFPQANNHEELRACYVKYYLQTDVKEKLFHGAMETLHSLSTQGYQLAIATNKSSEGLQQALKRHNMYDLFVTTRCGDDTFTKPQPEVIWGILTELQTRHEETLMIGDTEFDMQVAINAKIDALAVGYGIRSKEQLLAYAPVACIDDIKELLPLLEKKHES